MCKVVYLTLTGNTKRLIKKINAESIELNDLTVDIPIDDDFILIVPSYEKDFTYIAYDFLSYEDNCKKCKGIIGCGNLNFGDLFCYSAIDLSKKFNIPIIRNVEYSGNNKDIEIIQRELDSIG